MTKWHGCGNLVQLEFVDETDRISPAMAARRERYVIMM